MIINFIALCVSSTAEAVLQEMDNISSIRQNREVERLRMWTGDTEEASPFILHCIKPTKKIRQVKGELLNGLA